MMFMVDVAMVKLPWVVRGIGHQSENFLRFPVWDGWPESICSVWKTNEHGTIICRYIIYHINPHNTVRQQSYRPLLAICQRKNGIYGMIIPVRTIRITGRGRSLYTAQFFCLKRLKVTVEGTKSGHCSGVVSGMLYIFYSSSPVSSYSYGYQWGDHSVHESTDLWLV